ncbi:MAG: HAD-IIA family hydrolase [Actinomycetia bacterium]|nr:HAD-IIA family hydrolase [Actinomycetes bacterium]
MTDWVVDLDGVMWRGKVPIEGSAEAIGELLARGDRVLFCTNNSAESGEARAARLSEQGIPDGCKVVTSADAVCALVEPGESVLVIGGPGLLDALAEHGARPTAAAEADPAPIVAAATARASDPAASGRPYDAVVVGLTRDFGYRQIDAAQAAVRAGARLLATNDDATFPGADGIHPGCGSLLAAVETGAGVRAEVAGKPLGPMCDLIIDMLGLGERGGASDGRGGVIVVGDRPGTDGRLAENLGVRFALVLSGVTSQADLPVEVPTALVGDDLAAIVTGHTEDR